MTGSSNLLPALSRQLGWLDTITLDPHDQRSGNGINGQNQPAPIGLRKDSFDAVESTSADAHSLANC
jgi:hypothetical protein